MVQSLLDICRGSTDTLGLRETSASLCFVTGSIRHPLVAEYVRRLCHLGRVYLR